MIGVKVEPLQDKVGEIRKRFHRSAVRTIFRMSGYQMMTERNSMKRAPRGDYSPAGTSPNTHPRTSRAGNTLPAFPQFIRFKVEEKGFNSKSVVGPTKPSSGRRASWAERIGHTHEFGGTSTIEKRVYYRPYNASDKGKGRPVVFKDKRGKAKPYRSKGLVLFKNGGTKKTFAFNVIDRKYSGKNIVFRISYRATYPKRPFAAPALRQTITATRQGKFD